MVRYRGKPHTYLVVADVTVTLACQVQERAFFVVEGEDDTWHHTVGYNQVKKVKVKATKNRSSSSSNNNSICMLNRQRSFEGCLANKDQTVFFSVPT